MTDEALVERGQVARALREFLPYRGDMNRTTHEYADAVALLLDALDALIAARLRAARAEEPTVTGPPEPSLIDTVTRLIAGWREAAAKAAEEEPVDDTDELLADWHAAHDVFAAAGYMTAERGVADCAEETVARVNLLAAVADLPAPVNPPRLVADRKSVVIANDLARRIAEFLAARTDEEAMPPLNVQLLTILDRYGRRTDSIQWAVENACIEARQYRESASHHRQIAEHYRDALAALLGHVTDDPLHSDYLHHVDKPAVAAARVALDRLPEWNGILIA
jgi:hypothetical protein